MSWNFYSFCWQKGMKLYNFWYLGTLDLNSGGLSKRRGSQSGNYFSIYFWGQAASESTSYDSVCCLYFMPKSMSKLIFWNFVSLSNLMVEFVFATSLENILNCEYATCDSWKFLIHPSVALLLMAEYLITNFPQCLLRPFMDKG